MRSLGGTSTPAVGGSRDAQDRADGLVADPELSGQLAQRAAAGLDADRRLLLGRKLPPPQRGARIPVGVVDVAPLGRFGQHQGARREDAPAEPIPVASAISILTVGPNTLLIPDCPAQRYLIALGSSSGSHVVTSNGMERLGLGRFPHGSGSPASAPREPTVTGRSSSPPRGPSRSPHPRLLVRTGSGYFVPNLLMTGPPGSGKTLLARALPSILPAMTIAEALEVTKIYSSRGCRPARL